MCNGHSLNSGKYRASKQPCHGFSTWGTHAQHLCSLCMACPGPLLPEATLFPWHPPPTLPDRAAGAALPHHPLWVCTESGPLCQDSHQGSLCAGTHPYSSCSSRAQHTGAVPLGSGMAAVAFGDPPGYQLQVTALDLLPQKVLCATWPPLPGSGLHRRCQVATFSILTLLEFAAGGDTPVHKVPISVKADVSTLLAGLSSREACS